MPQVNVTTNVRRVDATASVIDIQGEITAFAETALMDAYTHASTPTTRSIILNFNALDYMNSSGIGVLVTLLIRINRQKQHLLCYGLSDHYQKIFAITRLDDAIRNYATEEEALAEATMNAMEHGNHYLPEKPVAITVQASNEALLVRIVDHGGTRLLPGDTVEPDIEAKLAGLQSPRGWGLFLIKNMVDDMHIFEDATHHTVELIMNL